MILEPVSLAVIGCEGYSLQWIKRLLSVPDFATLRAVSAVDLQSPGAQFCRQQGLIVVGSVGELLAVEPVEVVVNPTPIHLHMAVTIQCLKAGRQVWLEKPAVATVQDFDALLREVESHGRAVPVCYNSLFSKLTQDLKQELVAGTYGRIRRIKGIGSWIRTSAYFGRNNWAGRLRADGHWILDGDLNNAFAHVLCNNLFFAGTAQETLGELEEIQAELYRCNALSSEDTSCARIVTREGVEVLTYLSLAAPCEIAPLTLIEAERARIYFEDFSRIRILRDDGTVEVRESYQEHRIEMIAHLCRAHRLGRPYIGNLAALRPFTEAVNGVFESSGVVHAVAPRPPLAWPAAVHAVPAPYLRCEEIDAGSHYRVPELDQIMRDAFEANALFSELGVPWARAGTRFAMKNYASFPQRFHEETADAGRQDLAPGDLPAEA